MRTELEVKSSLAEMERMTKDARAILNNDTVIKSKVLTDKFNEWMHRCEARANILKWVLCLPYLEEASPVIKERDETQNIDVYSQNNCPFNYCDAPELCKKENACRYDVQ